MATHRLTAEGPTNERTAGIRGRVEGIQLERWAIPIGIVLYAIWATIVTWPVMSDPGGSVVGGIGDQTGGIAQLRAWLSDGLFPFAPGTVHQFSAPEGLPLAWGVNLSGWPWTLVAWLIAVPFGAVAAFAVTTWIGFVLSGVTMQILATRLTGSRLAGLVAGFAFAFYPFATMNAASHPQFSHGWPLALLAWRMLEVSEAATRRNVILASLAAILAVGFSPYYILIGGVLLATCMVLAVVRGWREGRLKSQVIAIVAIGTAVVLYLGLLSAVTLTTSGGQGGTLRDHPESELVSYSARAYEYVVPFAGNAVFGDDTRSWITDHRHGSNSSEATLYLGVIVLLLGFVALVASLIKGGTSPRLRWAALAGLVITVVGVYWSAPPHVELGGASIPAPSSVVEHVSTTWRVYSRFVVDVMLGAALLGAVGLATLIRGRGPIVSVAITTLALGAVAVDFTWQPGTTKIVNPPAYKYLKDHPGGIVAQYPLLPSGYGDSADIFYQRSHGHPVLNGYAETGYADRRASTLYYLNRTKTAIGLASLGVRYVFLPDVPTAGTPDPGRPGAGFKLVSRGAYGGITASVYQVTQRPDLGYVYVRTGGGGDEGGVKDPFTWLTAPTNELTVDSPDCHSPCGGRLRLRLQTFARPRDVTLKQVGGDVLWHGRVRGSRTISMRLVVKGTRARIRLTTNPGPVSIKSVDPTNQDPRAVSINVSRMRFTAR